MQSAHSYDTVNLTFILDVLCTHLEHIVKFRNSRKTVRKTFRAQIQQRLYEHIDLQRIELGVGVRVHFFGIL